MNNWMMEMVEPVEIQLVAIFVMLKNVMVTDISGRVFIHFYKIFHFHTSVDLVF